MSSVAMFLMSLFPKWENLGNDVEVVFPFFGFQQVWVDVCSTVVIFRIYNYIGTSET